jgi:acetate kinase
MATRSGSVDPGLVLWLEEHEQLPPHEVATALEQRSGLAALAGTPDMREVVTRADAGDADARLGLDVYLHRLAGSVAAMATSAGGLDVLVFTGGVGERSAPVRAGAADRLGWLGVRVDAARNGTVGSGGVTDITGPDGAVRVLVLEAREDLQMAHEVRALLAR